MLYWIYNAVWTLVLVLGLPLVPLVAALGERFRRGLAERFGFYPRALRGALRGSRPVWVHAASVGEVVAAKALVGALKAKFPERKVLLSTFTATGREAARRSAGADGSVLLPLDHPWIVRRALRVFDPCLLVLMETELWPNLLKICHGKGIPVVLLSGRLSPGSFRYYYFFRAFFSRAVGRLTALGMQSAEDAERMVRLGADPARVRITGNLKQAAAAGRREAKAAEKVLPPDGSADRHVLVAGSTHRGEEEILVEAFRELKAGFAGLVMVLAPRHPQRFAEVERLLKRSGVRYSKRSAANGGHEPAGEVVFLDTLGELADFYAVADIAFVGGSLVDAGGHNVIEPARCQKPVLFGPHMGNFARISEELKLSGGGIEVRGKEDLVRELSRLFGDPPAAARAGESAYRVAEADRKIVEGSMDLVSRYF
ncbi:MAG TPA: 3-deoxy-D-manno-octulosonic acid transferase [Candidatus Binatia bacterium]